MLRQGLAALLLAAIALPISGELLLSQPIVVGGRMPRRPLRFSGAGTDSQLVYGPAKFTHTGSNSQFTSYSASFDADTVHGRRYVLEVKNSSCSAYTVTINGQSYIGSSETGGGSGDVFREIDVLQGAGANELDVSVVGTGSTSISVKISRVSDATFVVYGPKTFTKPSPAAKQVDTLVLANAAKPPYTLRVINGSGSGSNRVTNATLTVNGVGVIGSSDLGTGIATKQYNVSLNNSIVNRDTLDNQSASGTYVSLRYTATDSTPPSVTVSAPVDTFLTTGGVRVNGSVSDETYGIITIDTVATASRAALPTPGSFTDSLTLQVDRKYTLYTHAINSAWLTTDVNRTMIRDTRAPTLVLTRPSADTSVTASADTFTITGYLCDSTKTNVTVDGDTVLTAAGVNVGFTWLYHLDVGQNGVLCRAIDALGHKTEFKRWIKRAAGSETARDSVISGSAPSSTGIRSFKESVQFLFTGGGAIQIGATGDSIGDNTASVIRGKVLGRDGTALSNVTVDVLSHPEFGYTLTRDDGWFNIVVNGGRQVTLRFNKTGYLEFQRHITPFPNDYAIMDSIALVGKTARKTYVDLSAGQFARGRLSNDANGDRDMRVLFEPGTVAKVDKPSGDSAVFSGNVRLRITEFTIGPSGPAAMPAALPPGSAYSYCVDYSLDETDSVAAAVGENSLKTRFTKPVLGYVKNFLHLPVGSAMPNGFYDSKVGQWMADTDATVIKILGFSAFGDTARLDTYGNGLASSQFRLDSLLIDNYELTHLRSQFAAGDTIMRVLMRHFSDRDLNPPHGPAPQPLNRKNSGLLHRLLKLFGCVTDVPGSIIECESCVLGEELPIKGSPFTLNYRSYRAPGEKALRTLQIPILGDSVPPGLSRVITYLDVAGKRYKSIDSSPAKFDSVSFTWDGYDVYGRFVDGSMPAHVRIGYEFPPVLGLGSGGASFANQALSKDTASWNGTGDRNFPFVTWVGLTTSLGVPSTASDGLGGWTISPHHTCDLVGEGGLYRGDGTVVLGEEQHAAISSVAGCVTVSTCSDGGSCADPLQRTLNPNDIEVGPDGTLFIADGHLNCIYKLPPSGATMCRIAGTGSTGPYTDNVTATSSNLRNPRRLALAPDGAIYFVMDFGIGTFDGDSCPRVAKITPDGKIHAVTSKEPAPYGSPDHPYLGTGDGGSAIYATISEATSIALGPDGSVFVGDYDAQTNNRVRRIGPDGIITTYAGGVGKAASDSPGRATSIGLTSVEGLTVDENGDLYIAEEGANIVKQVTRSGMMSNLMKGSPTDFQPVDLEFARDGSLLVASAGADTGTRVYKRDSDGNISVVVGAASGGAATPGGYATATQLFLVGGMGVGPNGDIYLSENNQVVSIKKPFPIKPTSNFTVSSEDGSEIYCFDKYGRHLWTRDALTGGVRYLFNYDSFGRLKSIYDANGDSTRITRDGSGAPQSIIAPNGQTTTLALSGDYLRTVTNPASETVTLGYDTGLLTSFVDAKSQEHDFTYNASDGRLHVDSDPESGSQTMTSSTAYNKHHITRTTALGRVTAYDVTTSYDGSQQRATTGPEGLVTQSNDQTNGVLQAASPTGAVVTDSLGPSGISSIGMLAPTLARELEAMPSGLKRLVDIAESQSDHAGFGAPLPSGTWTRTTNVNSRSPQTTTFAVSQGPYLGKLVTISAVGRRDSTIVDTAGRPLSISIPNLTTCSLSYDARGRLTLAAQGARGWRYSYDGSGRLAVIRDTLGRMTTFAYNNADRVTGLTLPDSRQIQFGYDANGNVTSVTPPGSNAHSFDYSGVDQTLHYTPPTVTGVSSPATSYTYNNDHQLTRITRPDGLILSLAYNSTKGRLDSLTLARGRAGLFYNGTSGQLDSLSSPDTVSVYYGYDGALPTSEQWTGRLPGISSLTVSRTFNPQFQESTQTVGSTAAVSYSHDLDGLLVGAGALTIHRDAQNGLPDSTAAGNLTSSADYDGSGDLANLSYSYNGSVIYRQSLARDAIGRVTAISEYGSGTTKSWGYRYDLAGRLYGVTLNGDSIAIYGYDADGNRTSFKNPQNSADTASAKYDQQDRMLRYKNTAYTYTAAGDLATKISGTDTTTYSYDAIGSLTRVKLPNGDVVTYSMDGTGRRVGRRLNGAWTGGWVYRNALNVVGELDNTGAVKNRYIYGTEGHVPAMVVRGDSTYRLITDQLGSVKAVVNIATGAVLQQTDYDAWGVPTVMSGSGAQALGYVGGIADAATGLVRFGVRDYDAGVGRWTARDPIGPIGGSNNYLYVNGSPLLLVDPAGLCTLQLGLSINFVFAFGLAVTGGAGIAIDDMGHVAGYRILPLGGLGVGAGASGGITVAVSDAQTIASLRGPFADVSATGGAGVGITATYFQGEGQEPGEVVHGVGVTVGPAVGAGAAAQGTTTHVFPDLLGPARTTHGGRTP
jgi:RHS repeat-associated protein